MSSPPRRPAPGAPRPPPPAGNLPPWLWPYAYVSGWLTSAPLDLPQRFAAVVRQLEARGWRVVVRSIGTDFEGPMGLPVPRDQPLELFLWRPGGFGAVDAARALGEVLAELNLSYSPLRAWLLELRREVVRPTTRQAGELGALGWLAIGAAALVWADRRGRARR